jgi:phosphotriesterase-related protein
MTTVQTVTGPIGTAELGRTLMHEHLAIGFPGWDAVTTERFDRAEAFRVCVDWVQQLQALGYQSIVDPCPNDLGRDVELMVEVAQATGFNIICATGLYLERLGGSAHWQLRKHQEDLSGPMAELFVSELTDGIGETGVRAGLIKVATGPKRMTHYEASVFAAAAAAAAETGVPITTHTDDGLLGDVQQEVLTGAGVDPHRIIIGHSCGSTDHDYHMGIARGGSYLGFDRFGIQFVSDDARVKSLAAVVAAGAGDRVVISHDSVWCWKGNPFARGVREAMAATMVPTLIDSEIIPKLLDAGVTDEQVHTLTHENPRRYFEGDPLPGLGR